MQIYSLLLSSTFPKFFFSRNSHAHTRSAHDLPIVSIMVDIPEETAYWTISVLYFLAVSLVQIYICALVCNEYFKIGHSIYVRWLDEGSPIQLEHEWSTVLILLHDSTQRLISKSCQFGVNTSEFSLWATAHHWTRLWQRMGPWERWQVEKQYSNRRMLRVFRSYIMIIPTYRHEFVIRFLPTPLSWMLKLRMDCTLQNKRRWKIRRRHTHNTSTQILPFDSSHLECTC